MSHAPHVLLVGGGHATVAVLKRAQAWTRSGHARVTLLSDYPALYYSGMVPEHLGGVYAEDEVQIDLSGWCRRASVQWQRGQATRLDPDARTVHTARGDAFHFDLAVFDIGARNPGTPPGAIPTKPLHRIRRLERFVRSALAGGSSNGSSKGSEPQRLVIAGGGAAGVETALNVSARLHAAGRPGALRLTVAEPAARLLPGFPEGMSAYAMRVLRRRGVRLRLSARVASVEGGEGALLDTGERVPCDEVLWATGSEGPPLFQEAGLPCNRRGFVRVRPSLRCQGAPRVFAAGDCAVVEGHEGLARVGVHAVKQGATLAENVERALQALRASHAAGGSSSRHALGGASFEAFKPYLLAPLILSTGQREGLWSAGGLWLRGPWALRLKHLIDLRWMNRYRLPPAERAWPLRETLHARSAHPARRL